MDSINGEILRILDIFGKEFQICTIAGYVAYIDKVEYNSNENDSQPSRRAVKTNIFVRHNTFDIHECLAINKPFNGKIGDKIVITCIKNENNEKSNITLINIDSGQSLILNNVNKFLYLLSKVEKFKIVVLEGLLGCSIATFLYYSIYIDGSCKTNGAVTSYCIAVMLYFALSIFLKMHVKEKRSIYASSIQKNIEAVSEQINCPIRFKFSVTK